MPTNLFGKTFETTGDYSRRLLLLGLKQPHYKVSREPSKTPIVDNNHQCALLIQDEIGKKINYTTFSIAGLYAIYNGLPGKDNCLYVGISSSSVSKRIYRFIKELHDISHKEESHPAAKKARQHGITDNNLYFKILPMNMFPKKNDDSYVADNVLDEYLAVMLQSKFNKKVRK